MTAAALSREIVLIRQPALTIHLTSNGDAEIIHDGRKSYATMHALAIIEAFSEPRPVGAVIDELAVRSAHDFAMLASAIGQLYACGVLVAPGREPTLADGTGWDAASIHARMLDDADRTRAFLGALGEVVRPDDTVMDIGTGTGILAIGAARAGARRVIGIESSSMADVAREVVARNGLSERVEIVRGWSTRVSPSGSGTVFVSETVGNQAVGEGIVETAIDAKRRFLSADARFIPSHIRVYAQPCVIPVAVRRRHVFCPENIRVWSERYGIDLSPLHDRVEDRARLLMLRGDEARGWQRLGPPVLLVEIDLANPEPVFSGRATATIEREGELDAFVEFFELVLSPSITFDGHPDHASPACSWGVPIWALAKRRPVEVGDHVHLEYSYQASRGRLRIL